MSWTEADIPDLAGKTIVVTGANSGLGLETTRMLTGCGAHVVMACRTAAKAEEAMETVRSQHAKASVEFMALDLADLASIRAFAGSFQEAHTKLDVLINNAGVMALPKTQTADGFEMQLGTNHLGHFALTGALMPRLLETPAARVVTVSSLMHKVGSMRFEDLHGERGYDKWRAYSQSKLANLLFCYELDRRLRNVDADVRSVAAHPGYSSTNLQGVGPRLSGAKLTERFYAFTNRLVAQPARMGAMPSVFAAVGEPVGGGGFFGPEGVGQVHGYPVRVESNRASHDEVAAQRLWMMSVEATGETFSMLDE
ncbi:MAG: SDR family oxidoreductase [Nannocystaceae bacterium]|nr:SDR family oxidoreductase [Nannocystaceae bacterium]